MHDTVNFKGNQTLTSHQGSVQTSRFDGVQNHQMSFRDQNGDDRSFATNGFTTPMEMFQRVATQES